ncbi:kinase-like domain-containing protein [Auriculariales sp. MPI-PUGE-AT-0066]|nr:kinase-like domain-containing protein [Auriculariales sp. MPI-PUGE-AT-0066]
MCDCLTNNAPASIRVDFWRSRESYTLGRGVHNDVPLVSPKISACNNHCIISWRGDDMEVVVEDLSTNGTFINGQRIGRNNKQLLSQGQEISFGTATEDPTARQEFRYMYRHFGGGPAASGGIFDDYQLSTELGKGAFASVRRAIGIKDGNTYAVKIINQRLWHMNPGTQKMFQREMTIMSQLTHPNIVQWYQTYYDPSTIFLVMEFVNGKDLLELVIHSGTDDTMSRCITHNICSGVGFLHANNIVHRDLKPENVLIQNGPPMLAKIADFGLAKVVDDQTMLKVRQCGTPVYLAPEVVLRPPGQEAGYTELVDSWSTGVIVYSMLTMSMPFPEEDEEMDIRDRMRMRQVMWDQFTGVTNEAVDFCRRLIEPDIALRMSMEQALAHAWLNDSRMDLAHGWTQEMSDIGASANGNSACRRVHMT